MTFTQLTLFFMDSFDRGMFTYSGPHTCALKISRQSFKPSGGSNMISHGCCTDVLLEDLVVVTPLGLKTDAQERVGEGAQDG